MTKRLKEVIEALDGLPEEEQDAIADELAAMLNLECALSDEYDWLETLEGARLDGSQDASVTYERRLYDLKASND